MFKLVGQVVVMMMTVGNWSALICQLDLMLVLTCSEFGKNKKICVILSLRPSGKYLTLNLTKLVKMRTLTWSKNGE